MSSTRRVTRKASTVLGKRANRSDADESLSPTSSPSAVDSREGLITPENSPKSKRPRTSTEEDESRNNKENIPPLRIEAINRLASPRARTLSRTSTTDAILPRTPQSLRRTATGIFPTPATALSGLSLGTPLEGPPSSLVPLHVRVRGLLRATCNSSTSIAGRATERNAIFKFLGAFLSSSEEDASASTLYISGLPGTGKTALVNDIIGSMNMDEVVLININCMALNNVETLWERLQDDLGALKKSRGHGKPKKAEAKASIGNLLKSSPSNIVLILDELDHIGKASGSLANLFSVAHEHRNKIRIIGIANTHTLTASGSVFDGVDGVDILHFSAYSGQQLFEIIQTRLAPLYEDEDHAAAMKKFLSIPALNLLSKKIAAQTGDVRAVFEVLRGAIDAAVLSSSVTDAPTVTPAHVLAALKVYTPSSTAPATSASSTAPTGGNSQQATQVRGLGLQQRLVLLSVVLATQRLQTGLSLSSTGTASLPSPPKSPAKRGRSAESNTASIGAGSMDSAALHAFYSSVLTRGDAAIFSPVGRSEFADLLGMLETVGLVSLSAPSAKPGRQMSRSTSFKSTPSKSAAARAQAQDVKLAEGVRLDEVVRGLGCQVNVGTPSGDAPVDLREEEVRALYDREQTRMTRDVRNRASFVEEKNVFADALED